jgi:cation:H+ antiporter
VVALDTGPGVSHSGRLMDWLKDAGLVVAGLTALYLGAEWLVGGSSKLAVKWGISPLVVGLTIVAFGTSAPELFVSLQFMFADPPQPDAALGNVIGSNICNIALILGISALICRLVIKSDLLRRDLPILVVATIVFMAMLWDRNFARWEGIVMISSLVVYTIWCLRSCKKEKNPEVLAEFEEEFGAADKNKTNNGLLALMVFGGLVTLYFGAEWMKTGGIGLAERFGVSPAIISLTVVAFATSVPELATSIVASAKKEGDIITGNIIGSCLFNLLCVIGVTATVKPMTITDIETVDLVVVCGLTVLLIPIMFFGRRITRFEGVLLLACYFGYCGLLWQRINAGA